MDATTIGIVALIAMLMGGGGKKKSDPQPPADPEQLPPVDDGDEGAEEEAPPPPPPSPGNWGVLPAKWIPAFETAEKATMGTLPGLARFFAIKAWQARRAGQGILSPEEALAFAAANPNLCRSCHNTSAAERSASCRGIERVTLPKGQTGPCGGTGAYDKPWPISPYNAEWMDFGSAGLFDILASSALYAGIHEGFSPLVSQKPDMLFDPRVQMYVAGVMVYRIVKGQYPVLSATPRETWKKIARVYGAGSLSNSQSNIDVGIRFEHRAAEIGIDLDLMPMPTLATLGLWPGANKYSDALAGISVPQ